MISPGASPHAVSRAARSPEELFPLVDFCRSGKLKEVSDWIAKGKPLDPPVNAKRKRRQSPLEVAIEKGFYSLTELLLHGGCDPLANGNPLYDAVNRNEADIAKLLLERGVPIDSVDISTVFQADRSMIELFISVGADPTANLAYYEALCSKGLSAFIPKRTGRPASQPSKPNYRGQAWRSDMGFRLARTSS